MNLTWSKISEDTFLPDVARIVFKYVNILSQSYNATVFCYENISFLAHVLNQLLLPNESSISQASYCTMVLTICFQLFKKQTIYGGRVVETNEMHGDVPVSDMRHAFCAL